MTALPPHYDDPVLGPEARAFDARIAERIAAGFVPDLRFCVPCDHFYKSFWRDPCFIALYEGRVVETYLSMIEGAAGGRKLRILDVGCGAGYVTLELARNGHDALGIDISCRCVEAARAQMAAAPRPEGFGALEYRCCTLDDVAERFDLVLFSVSLHHLPDPEAALATSGTLLRPGGLLLCCEPRHELWRTEDAAQVAFIRMMLAAAGCWFDPEQTIAEDPEALSAAADEVLREYREERDSHETGGQSPNDLQTEGGVLLDLCRRRFEEIETRPGASFIYRVLGGLRGETRTVRRLARLLAAYDRHAVETGALRPNFFFFIGRRREG